MSEFLDDAERLTILSQLHPDAFTALDLVLAENEQQPDMPLSASCRRVLATCLPTGVRVQVERLLARCDATEGRSHD